MRAVRRGGGVAIALLLFVSAPAPAGELRARLRRPTRGIQVRVTPVTIPAQSEREICEIVTLGNRRAVDVSEITAVTPSRSTAVTHHLAIFDYEGGGPVDVPPGVPFDSVGCLGVGGQEVSPILAFVQQPRQTIRFPSHVGLRIPPAQRVMLNLHYINSGPEPVTVDAAVNLRAARRGAVTHHVRSFQLGTLNIFVPPGKSGSATGSWATPFPMNLVWLSTHSHKHTQSVDVDLVRQGVVGGEVLRTVRYSEPTVQTYADPLRLAAGDGFRWTCNYRNDTGIPLTFGVTSNDEMCFTVGFFYADDDAAPLPLVPGCFGDGDGLVCPDN
jgi:copper type II ascorbate-dependent monooxygenase-like protein